ISENFSDHPVRSEKPQDWLSLAELESFDPRANGYQKTERRFCCPLCGTDKPFDAKHRSLTVNTKTGAYICHRCKTAGKIREFCDDAEARTAPARQFPAPVPAAAPKSDDWRKWFAQAKPITGTRGASYLAGRSVPSEIAESAGVKFSGWYLDGAVL